MPDGTDRPTRWIGRTKEGIRIPHPGFEPQSFTREQLERAVKAARRRAEDESGMDGADAS